MFIANMAKKGLLTLSATFWYSLVTDKGLFNIAQISHPFKYLCLTCSFPFPDIPRLLLVWSRFTYFVTTACHYLPLRINYVLLCSYTLCTWEHRVPRCLFTLCTLACTLRSTGSCSGVPGVSRLCMSGRKVGEWERPLSRQNSWPPPQLRCPSFPSFLWCVCLMWCVHMFVWVFSHIHEDAPAYICTDTRICICAFIWDQRTISSVFLNLSPHYISTRFKSMSGVDWYCLYWVGVSPFQWT